MLSCIIFRKESDSGHLGADFTTFHSENCQVKVRRPKTGPSDRKFGTIIRPKKSQESSLFISGPFGACFLRILAQNFKNQFFKNPISSYIILYYAPHSYPHMRGVWYFGVFAEPWGCPSTPTSQSESPRPLLRAVGLGLRALASGPWYWGPNLELLPRALASGP